MSFEPKRVDELFKFAQAGAARQLGLWRELDGDEYTILNPENDANTAFNIVTNNMARYTKAQGSKSERRALLNLAMVALARVVALDMGGEACGASVRSLDEVRQGRSET